MAERSFTLKRQKSKLLRGIALTYICFPVSYGLVIAILFDVPFRLFSSIYFSPIFWVVYLCAMVSGYGLWEMRRWSWALFLTSNILIAIQTSVIVSRYAETNNRWLAFAMVVVGIAALVYRVRREVRVPYLLPQIRWWESDPRYRLSVPVQLVRKDNKGLKGDILDISQGGCFVKLKDRVYQDEMLALVFHVFGQVIRCDGSVVWRTAGGVTHPRGIGVKFMPLDRSQKRRLRVATQRLRRILKLYSKSKGKSGSERFFQWLEELRTGVTTDLLDQAVKEEEKRLEVPQGER